MNEINAMRAALEQVSNNQVLLSEGKIADQMRALNKKRKARWDEKGESAKKDAYKALDHAKKTQDDLMKSDYIQNVGEGYKNIDRKTGKMAKKAALASQEAGIRKMGGKAQREGGLRNAVRKAVGLAPKDRPERENPDNPEKEKRARERAAKMLAVISTHKPGVAQDQEAINRERGEGKRARSGENNIRKTRREVTREEYYIALATLLGEDFADTTEEASYMLEEFQDLGSGLVDILLQ